MKFKQDAAEQENFSAFEHWDIKPDIITLAKGIGGGLPLGAILAKEEIAALFVKGEHGTTFGGNALACACGLVVLQELEKGVMENAKKSGEYFKIKIDELKKEHPSIIKDNRGIGLMRGVELSVSAKTLVELFLEKNIIANAAGEKVLRLVPPLILRKEDIDVFIKSFNEIMSDERIYE